MPRLDRLLANLGYGSRREVKGIIAAGRVEVGGVVARSEAVHVVDVSSVLVDGEPLEHPGGLTVVLNKPLGYVCSHDSREGPRAYDLLPGQWLERNPRLESVGRLDRDTTGVILFTDDHQLVHRLTSPKHHVPKTYVATLDGPAPESTGELFASGTLVLDGESTPCQPVVSFRAVEALSLGSPCYELVITEGRYHQVRRMFAAVGCHVAALERTRFGDIGIGALELGEHRVLSDEELDALRPGAL